MNWLLLRGLMREADHWGVFPKLLLENKSINRVLCLDLPGVGTESNRFFVPSIRQATEDLRSRFQLIEKNHQKENWGILAISLGGMIAMDWVSRYSDFKKIVLINSSAADFPLWHRLKPTSMLKSFEIFLDPDLDSRERKIISMTSNLRKNDPELLKAWITIAQKSKFSKVTALNQLLAASLFRLPGKISIPLLILASRADRMVDWRCSEKIAEKYRAQIKIHPTSGHDLAVDDPQWIVDRLEEWTKSN